MYSIISVLLASTFAGAALAYGILAYGILAWVNLRDDRHESLVHPRLHRPHEEARGDLVTGGIVVPHGWAVRAVVHRELAPELTVRAHCGGIVEGLRPLVIRVD